jgi:D-glycero-D-manno-heptose 1,7-bisphosphate phosphatase
VNAQAAPAAFIDRDGTLVVERHYLADPAGVELVPGAVEALRRLRAAGYRLVLVTNQSGIARGLYTEADFHAVQERLAALLATAGIRFDSTQFCPHHPDITGPCDCRKPAAGMFLRAAQDVPIDFARSIFIGDRLKDVLPARTLGGRGYLVRTGYGALQEGAAGDDIQVVDDLAAAVEHALCGAPEAA